MSKNELLTLYTYNAYANKLVLDTIEKLSGAEFAQQGNPSHGSVHGLLLHMLECEAFFLARCQGQSSDLESVGLSTPSSIRGYWSKLEQDQFDFIALLTDTDMACEIKMQIRGQSLVFSVWQLLTQAFVHSVHHRGELSMILTGLGHPLPTLDILLHFIQQSGQSWPSE